MTDSPRPRGPLDPKEQPILDRLYEIRSQLELLKQDKSTYVKSQDVIQLYEKVIEQVIILNEIRTTKRTEQNKVDQVLDDCFQLISLSFLTIGRNAEAPAVYSAISTIKRLLDHIREAAFFSAYDLRSIKDKLREYRECIRRGHDTYSPHLITLLEARLDVCEQTLKDVEDILSPLTPELSPHYEKLVSVLRSLSACNIKSKFPTKEVDDLYEQALQVERDLGVEHPISGECKSEETYLAKLKTMEVKEGEVPTGQKTVLHLLTRCFLWIDIMRQRQGRIDERFKETYNKLLKIRNQLEQLQLTQAWSLRETDLYSFQRALDRIDESRVDGNFLDALDRPADIYEQRTLLYLLRKSYALIYLLIISSEPVSEALQPIYNQLLTMKRCLVEVKKAGGVSNPRELYPYSMKV
jgi:hypothetical protein